MAAPALSRAEAAVYDRQIRVWGVDTQQRLNAAKVLIAGSGGLVAEVAKNVVLAGAGLVALMDDAPCSSALGTSFLLPYDAPSDQSVAQVSVATLQEMNPLVKVTTVPGSPAAAEDKSFVARFDVVLVVSPSLSLLQQYDAACMQHRVAFFGAASRGLAAFFMANLQSHTYSPTEKQDGVVKAGQRTSEFCSLQDALRVPWSGIRLKRTHELYFALRGLQEWEQSHSQQPWESDVSGVTEAAKAVAEAAGADSERVTQAAAALAEGQRELPPVNAVVGGMLANEVLKAVSHKGEPANNFFFYSLSNGVGIVECLRPPPP